ncbi:MAG: sugar ABC transporter ATP-binding protein [Eubacteriales bacterium]|nr:sugar ABC transporter ATP-binding protein [Eubacteriales bacterium]
MNQEIICKIENVTKRFPGTTALDDVSFNIAKGEIHAIVGENGAGKSTLMNILSGVYGHDEGVVTFEGRVCDFGSTNDARRAGIAMIHQELSLANGMTAAENVFMNRMPKNRFGVIDYKKMNGECQKYLEKLGVHYISPKKKVKEMSISEQQLLEISKAVSLNAKMIIMDEPTSSLTSTEVEFLLKVVMQMKVEGVSILYISHKLEEIMRIADTITVLRDGKHIITSPASEMNEQKMVSYMVGREFEGVNKRDFITNYQDKIPVLSVKNLYDMAGKVKNVSFDLYAGEVLGLTGLVGAGRSEVLQCIFGANKIKSGQIFLDGKEVHITNCDDAIKLGIGLIPEGRKIQGLFLKLSVRSNEMIVYENQHSRHGIRNTSESRALSEEYRDKLRIKTPTLETQIVNLSGGNQQKAIVARWLMNNPRILFMDEPTHGIDIGAKNEIYKIVDDLAKQGVAVILLSSEMPEVLSLADRIMIMHHGYKRGELMNAEADQYKILSYTLEDAVTEDEIREREEKAAV